MKVFNYYVLVWLFYALPWCKHAAAFTFPKPSYHRSLDESTKTKQQSKPKQEHFSLQPFRNLVCSIGTATSVILASVAFSVAPVANAIESSLVEGQLPALNPAQRRYNEIINSGDPTEVSNANEKLIDHAVGTINTMYYDKSGGNNFDTHSFYDRWKALRSYGKGGQEGLDKWKETYTRRVERERADWVDIGGKGEVQTMDLTGMPENIFETRENAVMGLNWLVSTLNDPFSKYLTKEQLFQELKQQTNGFLGLGAIVEPPDRIPEGIQLPSAQRTIKVTKTKQIELLQSDPKIISIMDASNLPVVTAISPNSPAERMGLVVGDRIVAAGSNQFLGLSSDLVMQRLDADEMQSADNMLFIIAKPIIEAEITDSVGKGQDYPEMSRENVIGYRETRIRYAAKTTPMLVDLLGVQAAVAEDSISITAAEGNGIVQYKLLTPADSIFRKLSLNESRDPVGYIRLTRFSRAATAGYIDAVEKLEAAGAQSYIIDVRNNYGGIIQEAMLTASTLLRDPHTVLCYTLNARGGFTPHDAEEYIVDKRYPGYFLSSESSSVTMDQAKVDDPELFENGGASWVPPSSYASLSEQRVKRKLVLPSEVKFKAVAAEDEQDDNGRIDRGSVNSAQQKRLVVLVNEGTASAAEMFAAALRDNGRAVALVGAKTYGKGLIQHTFPLPDGGGLRLTVAEYLTPSLKHVTKVGSARYDSTGEFVGGITPDIQCSSNQGIPADIGADVCVGIALDALD